MRDGMKAITTAMAHIEAYRNNGKKVKGVLRDRAEQYSQSVNDMSKRLAVPEGDVLSPDFDEKRYMSLIRDKGMLDNIKNS